MYKVYRNSLGIVDAINRDNDGASIPYDPIAKTFDEENLLVIELREWEAENGALDLSRQPPPLPPLEELKQNLTAQIIAIIAQKQGELVSGYAAAEQTSWSIKIAEAEKIIATGKTDGVICLLAEARATAGITDSEQIQATALALANKIIEKRSQLSARSGILAGIRTRLNTWVATRQLIEELSTFDPSATIQLEFDRECNALFNKP